MRISEAPSASLNLCQIKKSAFLYFYPFLCLIASFIVSIKIHEDPEICDLNDNKEQDKVDAHIFADELAKYENSSERCEQYPLGQVTPSFPVIQP